MEIKKEIVFFVSFLVLSLFLSSLISALSPPLLPDHFKGNLLIDDNNASIGTEIKIYINNELKDTVSSTILGKYDIYVKTGNYNDEIKFKVSNILVASSSQRKGGEIVNTDFKVWNDRDGDGVNDANDKLIGNSSSVNDNFNNLSVFIENNETLFGVFSGNKIIKFKDGDKEILSFSFDFDNNTLILYNINVTKQTGSEGSIIVKGMPSGVTKSVYIDKLGGSSNAVCIKDEEISSISELSSSCDQIGEVKLNCPGSSGNYACTLESGRFKITGLQHSGVKEFYIAPPASPPATPSSGGGGGGGGGGGVAATSKKTTSSNTTFLTDTLPNENTIDTITNENNTQTNLLTGSAISPLEFVQTGKGIVVLSIIGVIFIGIIFKFLIWPKINRDR
ncbi:MAG: hypothetical protein Q7S33_01875 [Nanoarchaeota archaeon]|nr:hypothetical protein [Nanoarchaeota archaeon]